jgi:hypothetical protein
MGFGGGDTLTYSNMPTVKLETFAANAGVFLDAPNAASGESSFTVNMHGAGETTTLDETPKNVTTIANGATATNASVALWGNFGPAIIDGNASTAVNIGFPLSSTGVVTRGIEASVFVQGAKNLVVNDSGNVSTAETVTVTPSTIKGTGLFGSDGVTVFYGGVGSLILDAGQKADQYTVVGAGATFTSHVQIDDFSTVSFSADVIVDAHSKLRMGLANFATPDNEADLFIQPAAGGTVSISGTPNGVADVFFARALSSQISFSGFGLVEAI